MKKLCLLLFIVIIVGKFTYCQKINELSPPNSPKGILVSVEELQDIKAKAKQGLEPYRTNIKLFLNFVDSLMQVSKSWSELNGEITVYDRSSGNPIQISSTGGRLVYGTALAWHLTGDEKYAERAKELILDLTDTYGYRNSEEKEFHWGAQGILNLARGGTPYIYAADLLEGWKGWTASDKLSYQIWLRDVMYNKVAWASRTRKNNWGVAGSFSAALIAFYLADHPDWELEELSPVHQTLSPSEAYNSHNAYQIGRLSTSDKWKMDAKVSLWGILPNGAIPEEIRRGDDPIDGDYLPSDGSGTLYTMTHIEHLTAHAEFLLQRGDSTLYDHVASDGSGSLLQAYLFVIDNPKKSHCFSNNNINALYMAYHFYKSPAMLRSLKECGPGSIVGQRLALFGRLTHSVVFNNP